MSLVDVSYTDIAGKGILERGKRKRQRQEARGHSVSEGQQESWRGWRVVRGTAVETGGDGDGSQLGWNLLHHNKDSELCPYM